ncbi:hypothetical protein AQ611_07820 [Burkholderia singularis]|nr:hypothetical protein AQ611_07820 [Burkholderia sp. Bp7605]
MEWPTYASHCTICAPTKPVPTFMTGHSLRSHSIQVLHSHLLLWVDKPLVGFAMQCDIDDDRIAMVA